MLLRAELRGVDKVIAQNAAIETALRDALFQTIKDQTNETRREMRRGMPKFTGNLRAHVRVSRSRKTLTGTVKSKAKHTHLVLKGRKPGKMPPIVPSKAKDPKSAQRFLDWAQAKGIDPFILARAIALRGTRADDFFSGPEAQAKLDFPVRVRETVDRVLAQFR